MIQSHIPMSSLDIGGRSGCLIYGSTTRGTELASSDVDLMVIGDVDGWSDIQP